MRTMSGVRTVRTVESAGPSKISQAAHYASGLITAKNIVLTGTTGSRMPRLSYLGLLCILIVAVGAVALSWISPMEPDDAVAGSASRGVSRYSLSAAAAQQ